MRLNLENTDSSMQLWIRRRSFESPKISFRGHSFSFYDNEFDEILKVLKVNG